jgi:hypothetical protein
VSHNQGRLITRHHQPQNLERHGQDYEGVGIIDDEFRNWYMHMNKLDMITLVVVYQLGKEYTQTQTWGVSDYNVPQSLTNTHATTYEENECITISKEQNYNGNNYL